MTSHKDNVFHYYKKYLKINKRFSAEIKTDLSWIAGYGKNDMMGFSASFHNSLPFSQKKIDAPVSVPIVAGSAPVAELADAPG
ncbi:MAG: hypothetical protein ABIH86_06790 [Planctomycetota bacterium]